MELDVLMIFPVITSFSSFPQEKVLESDRVHRTHGMRQPVKIVYYRTGFIVEALPHI